MKKISIIIIFVIGVFSFLAPINFLLNFAHDDSFFYLNTAKNFAQGLGSTFDGINPTNGYHPLWFLTISAVYFIVNLFTNASPEFLFRITFIVHAILCVLIAVYLYKAMTNVSGKDVKQFAVILILLFILVFPRDFGIESHIACLILSLYLYIKSLEFSDGVARIISPALLIALLFLARTDYLLTIIPFIIITDIVTSAKEVRIRKLSADLGFVMTAAVLYYSANYLIFGSMTTTPGMILNSFPTILLWENIKIFSTAPEKIFNQTGRLMFLLAVIIIYTIILLRNRGEKTVRRKFIITLYGICIGSAVFAMSHLLFNYTGVREWYLTMPLVSCSVLATVILRRKYYNISIVFLLAVFAFVFYKTRLENYKFTSPVNYAKSLKEKTSADDRIFQIDFSGIVGFISERHIINGDGLANSFEYLNYKKEGRLKDYFRKYKVNYYSTYSYNILKGNDTLFTDTTYKDFSREYSFTYPVKDIVLRFPFYFRHSVLDLKGEWYLFKIYE